MFLERIAPYRQRLALLPARPQELADVRGDLRIGPHLERALQIGEAFLVAPHAVENPAHAVEYEGIVRGELQRGFDQLVRLFYAQVAVGEAVAERVVGVRVIGTDLDQL